MVTSTLIVFTRYPIPGQVKTRLIPVLGSQGATDLHRRLTAHTLEQARQLRRLQNCDLEVHIAGGDHREVRDWLGDDLLFFEQTGNDLGARMANAFAAAAGWGAQRMILVGTDIPDLSTTILAQAFAALEKYDVVLGPATDGGYYLVGLKQPTPALFADIYWGGQRVLEDTLVIADRLHQTTFLLEPLCDVDVPDDLAQARPFLEEHFRGIARKLIVPSSKSKQPDGLGSVVSREIKRSANPNANTIANPNEKEER